MELLVTFSHLPAFGEEPNYGRKNMAVYVEFAATPRNYFRVFSQTSKLVHTDLRSHSFRTSWTSTCSSSTSLNGFRHESISSFKFNATGKLGHPKLLIHTRSFSRVTTMIPTSMFETPPFSCLGMCSDSPGVSRFQPPVEQAKIRCSRPTRNDWWDAELQKALLRPPSCFAGYELLFQNFLLPSPKPNIELFMPSHLQASRFTRHSSKLYVLCLAAG